jgi:uncharacterized membrane protein YhaH (DUF805 family)
MSTGTFIVLVGLLFYVATCCAVIDIARKDFGNIQTKALWGFISLIPFIGPVVYFGIGYRRGNKRQPSEPQ